MSDNKHPLKLAIKDPGNLTDEQKQDVFVNSLAKLMGTAATLELPIALYNHELMKSVIAQVMMNVLISKGEFEAYQLAMQAQDHEALKRYLTEETVVEIHGHVLGVISRSFEAFFRDIGLDYSLKFVHTLEDYLKESRTEGNG